MMMFFAASKPCSSASPAVVLTFGQHPCRWTQYDADVFKQIGSRPKGNFSPADPLLADREGRLFWWVHDESTSTQALAEVVLQSERSGHVCVCSPMHGDRTSLPASHPLTRAAHP